MAIYNELLVGRFARGLQRLFGMKGSVPTKQLAGELMPVHIIRSGIEIRWLDSWNRFGWTIDLVATPGNLEAAQLRNPAGSNTIAVLEQCWVSAPAAAPVTIGSLLTNADLSSPSAATPLDGRQPFIVGQTSAINTSSTNNAAIVNPVIKVLLGANAPISLIVDENHEMPITPGQALRVGTTTVNLAFSVGFIWRERFLEESERS